MVAYWIYRLYTLDVTEVRNTLLPALSFSKFPCPLTPTSSDFKMLLLLKQVSSLLLGGLGLVKAATTRIHDASFIPDAVLRVTAENLAQSCLPPKWTVLVNGTAPGPELRLHEGKTYWIRVYNDMTDNNLTMVNMLLIMCYQERHLS